MFYFSAGSRRQRERNAHEAKQILTDYGDQARAVILRRIELSRDQKRNHQHWKRVLDEFGSLNV